MKFELTKDLVPTIGVRGLDVCVQFTVSDGFIVLTMSPLNARTIAAQLVNMADMLDRTKVKKEPEHA